MTERPQPPRRGPDQPGGNPLMRGPLPDWLAAIPMDAEKPTWVPFGENKRVPLDLITKAMTGKVGTTHGMMAIAPELAQMFAQHTEQAGWMNLPSEPTSVQRATEDTWEVHVGDYRETLGREALEQRVIEALLPPEDDQKPNP